MLLRCVSIDFLVEIFTKEAHKKELRMIVVVMIIISNTGNECVDGWVNEGGV